MEEIVRMLRSNAENCRRSAEKLRRDSARAEERARGKDREADDYERAAALVESGRRED